MTFNLDNFEWNPPVTSLAAFTAVKCEGAHHKHLQIIGVHLNYIDSSWLPLSQSSSTFQQYSHCLNHHIRPPLLGMRSISGLRFVLELHLHSPFTVRVSGTDIYKVAIKHVIYENNPNQRPWFKDDLRKWPMEETWEDQHIFYDQTKLCS